MVKWNEPYQKLASCDSTGIIFVWIKYEGRWSIELINDRNTPVTSFAWSHDGRMALICYQVMKLSWLFISPQCQWSDLRHCDVQDGFVLVGSVAGQRYWSTMLAPDASLTTGAWTPDDQQVYVATAQGGLIVMDLHGNIVNKVTLTADMPIRDLQWNCEKFNMEEREELITFSESPARPSNRMCVLAVSFNNGDIKLVTSYDDVSPVVRLRGIISEIFFS